MVGAEPEELGVVFVVVIDMTVVSKLVITVPVVGLLMIVLKVVTIVPELVVTVLVVGLIVVVMDKG